MTPLAIDLFAGIDLFEYSCTISLWKGRVFIAAASWENVAQIRCSARQNATRDIGMTGHLSLMSAPVKHVARSSSYRNALTRTGDIVIKIVPNALMLKTLGYGDRSILSGLKNIGRAALKRTPTYGKNNTGLSVAEFFNHWAGSAWYVT